MSAGIATDPDTFEPSEQAFTQLKPIRGRPRAPQPKIRTGLHLDADVLAAFKAGGKGWQTRINNALQDWLKSHPGSPAPLT